MLRNSPFRIAAPARSANWYRWLPTRNHGTKSASTAAQSWNRSADASSAEISTLSNGIRVASEDAPGHFVGVGVYLDAGSRFEATPQLRGLSHFLDRMAFKSTQTKSRSQITNILETLGGNVMCSSSRESVMYQSIVFRHHVDEIMQLYADTLLRPSLTDEEIQETRETIAYELEDMVTKPEWLVPELVHQTAFRSNTLGYPQLCTQDLLSGIDRSALNKYRNLFLRPSNLVIAGVGMDHQQLRTLAEKYFGQMKEPAQSSPVQRPAAVYTGGTQIHKQADLPLAHIALAYPGVSFTDDDLFAISTLQIMLGGGESFSAGGPGKGMYSRLYTNILNRFHWVEAVTANHLCYKDTGVFSLQASVPYHGIAAILDILAFEMRAVMDKPIAKVELNRAKNQLRSSLFMNMEARLVHLEDLGRQVQMTGTCMSPKEMSERIAAVTADDIKRVTRRVMENHDGTFVLVGESKFLPDLAAYSDRYGIGKLHEPETTENKQ